MRLRSLRLIGCLILALPLAGGSFQTSAQAATSFSAGAPGWGTWHTYQMWHGPVLGDGLVPAGTALDIAPLSGASKDVYAVEAGRIVGTCRSSTQSSVYVDSPGIGVIGYVHLATGSILTSGTVARGQRLGTLATTYQRSACATSWTGPHLHLALPARYDEVRLGGQRVRAHTDLDFPATPPPTKTFNGTPRASIRVIPAAVRVIVCADNLPGNTVTVELTRKGTSEFKKNVRYATQRATGRCVRFTNLDGPRATVPGALYTQRSAINQRPSSTWPGSGCWTPTNGQGLCSQGKRR